MSAVDRAAEVLIEHTRTSIEKCHCGWSDLGASHAEHVARALDEAGLLASEEHDRGVTAQALRDVANDMRRIVDDPRWKNSRFTEHVLIEHGVEQILNDYATLRDRADRIEERR